jgi:hypothetical protein
VTWRCAARRNDHTRWHAAREAGRWLARHSAWAFGPTTFETPRTAAKGTPAAAAARATAKAPAEGIAFGEGGVPNEVQSLEAFEPAFHVEI